MIPDCDGRADGQTESIVANTALCIARAMLTRCKNRALVIFNCDICVLTYHTVFQRLMTVGTWCGNCCWDCYKMKMKMFVMSHLRLCHCSHKLTTASHQHLASRLCVHFIIVIIYNVHMCTVNFSRGGVLSYICTINILTVPERKTAHLNWPNSMILCRI